MARDLIKFSNNKNGFRILLALEVLVAAWSFAAVLYAVKSGRTRTMIYGFITLFAAFYILGRSFRSYRELIKREKAEAEKKAGEDKTE